MTINGIKDLLNEPLNPKHIATRSQSGKTLSYVEGYYVIDTANRIFGHDGWDHTIGDIIHVNTEEKTKDGRTQYAVTYRARVTVRALGKQSEDIGFGTSSQGSLGDAHEMAGKTAVTDAMKRAFRVFGNQFGNSLYDKEADHTANFDALHIKFIEEIATLKSQEEVAAFIERNRDSLNALSPKAREKVKLALDDAKKRG